MAILSTSLGSFNGHVLGSILSAGQGLQRSCHANIAHFDKSFPLEARHSSGFVFYLRSVSFRIVSVRQLHPQSLHDDEVERQRGQERCNLQQDRG